ncbi:CopG family transcriptional regulator [Pseudanabaenaceae cyanobacterium LEGE 13415]|uniref:ribbon-helix-helix domain-containing protein n=1 Tax=unclassified Leptolyngbya TaxID=2650499 RepID=UPI001A02F83C|nr:CopG family transcriptional regulator [Pseudanabaenaceae cyanobacterium LEGE 13415]
MNITLQSEQEQFVQALIESGQFANAEEVIQTAIRSLFEQNRLAIECAKLDPQEEQAIAEEGMEFELETWGEY